MALAEAEAVLERVRNAEEDFLHDLSENRHLHIHLRTTTWTTRCIYRMVPDSSPGFLRDLPARRKLAIEEIHHKITERWTEPHVKHARLVRYRRDAEVRRHKALQAWIEELQQRFSKTNPIAA